jgi:hypothetical protein
MKMNKLMKTTAPAICACIASCLVGNASAALVVDLSAGSGTDTTVDGDTVTTWGATGDIAATTFTRSGGDARYVADSGGGIAAVDFDRSAPFLGDITAALSGSSTITNATIMVWANFDGYSHAATNSSYYFSINGSGNEHTLGRDEDAGGPDTIYHYDGGGSTYGTSQSTGWNLYIAKFYGTPVATISAEAWIDSVGDGAVVTGAADLTNSDNIGYNGNANSVSIGNWTSGDSGLDGQIRGLRIYDEILSDGDIQQAAASMTGVPEPSSIMLLAMGILPILRRKR